MNTNSKNVRCQRCNRVLKNTEAMSRGYGPHCYKLYLAEQQRNRNKLFTSTDNKEV